MSDSYWMADFETTTNEEDCRTWLWGMEHIPSGIRKHGIDINTFITTIADMGNTVCYFHNLGFDGSFIIDWLLRNGFRHRQGRLKLFKKNFSTLISGMGKFYSITVKWGNGNTTEFRDSLKKIPLSVASTAKAFKMKETKLSIDYDAPRPRGYRPTVDELDYIDADIGIMAKAIALVLEEGMKKLTVGADSLEEFKSIIGKKTFSTLFPVLPISMDSEIRQAYRGGWTYANPRFSGRIVGHGRTYDVNSLYPSVMYNCLLPYREPFFEPGPPEYKEDYPLFITSLTFTANLKPGHLPVIQVKNMPTFIPTKYQEDIDEPITMACTNVDLALWQEHYDLNIWSYNGTWYFRGMTGLFRDYIDKWMAVKEQSEGGMRYIAKLHLNSLYGKFATNPNVTPRIPYLKDGVVHLKLGEYEEREPVYTAMGAFITAYARNITIRAAQENYDTFAYADTDSLHLLVDEDPKNLDINKSRLGAWKHELTFSRAFFGRAKCYTEEHATKWHCLDCDDKGLVGTESEHTPGHRTTRMHTHIAGLPESVARTLSFDDFKPGRVFTGKLLPKRVQGGIVLEHTEFTLNL